MSNVTVIVLSGTGALCVLAAASFRLWASLIVVPDDIDTGILVIQEIGRIRACGTGHNHVDSRQIAVSVSTSHRIGFILNYVGPGNLAD